MKNTTAKHGVLIADDHKIFRVGLSAMLKNVRCVSEVLEAVNGKEALETLAAHAIDFVFMDIKMPVMDGVQATKAIVKKYPDVYVIAMSVYDDEACVQAMFESGARGYLLKNTDQEEIESAMRTVLSGNLYYAKTVSDNLLKQLMTRTAGEKTNHAVSLTLREKQLLYYLWLEMSSKEIAQKIFVSVKSVEVYRARLIEKTNSKNTVSLVKYALQHGIVKEMQESLRNG